MTRPKLIVAPHFRRMGEIFSEVDLARLHELGDVVWGRDQAILPDEFAAAVQDATAIVFGTWTFGPKALDHASSRLQAILEVAGSHHHPDLDYEWCFANNVAVGSCAPAFGPVVAEMALALTLATTRDVAGGDRAFRAGRERYLHEGCQDATVLFGRTVGFVGCGGLARSLQPLLDPFGVSVLGYDPWLNDEELLGRGIEPAGLEKLVAQSDVIYVLAAPSPTNRGLIDRALMERIRPGSVLVVISRAHLVDFDALTDLVLQGRFRAAIDVFPEEPVPLEHPIRRAENAVLSAHRAGAVPAALHEIGRLVVDDLAATLDGCTPLAAMPLRLRNVPDDQVCRVPGLTWTGRSCILASRWPSPPTASSFPERTRQRVCACDPPPGGGSSLSEPGAPMSTRSVEIYDTTLRDGTQQEGISLTARDKLRISRLLDDLGVAYIEGGWPGANPKDDEFFARARTELDLETATLVAFGATRRANRLPEDDEQLAALLAAETSVVCLVGKAWDYHVEHALRTSLNEAVAMVADSIAYLRSQGRRVFFDAEHFFDGYRSNPEFAVAVLGAAHDAGAERVVLCDTNGGFLAHEVERTVGDAAEALPDSVLGCHFHNDTGMAVANSLTAVRTGVTQVQGCINGYGERTGNADLCSVIPNLAVKMGYETIPEDRLGRLTTVSHHVAEVVNLTLDPHLPYVGSSAFTHKAGLHTSALARRSDAYEHLDPATIGNSTRVVVSELAGRSTVLAKAKASGLDLSAEAAQGVVDRIKRLEHAGYQFEAAGGSFELLVREAQGWSQDFYDLDSYRVFVEQREDVVVAEATVKVYVGGERVVTTREGDGPVSALDRALRAALVATHPAVDRIRLTDYRVRDLDSSDGTSARVRVLCEHSDGDEVWGTIGVHQNIIDASWRAVSEGLIIGLLREEKRNGNG